MPAARFRSSLAAVATVFALAAAARADVRLGATFADHMVLQRDVSLPVWGWATPGATVSVSFGGQTKTAIASGAGEWLLHLDPVPAGGEARELTARSGEHRVVIGDVLVGEVWICSGQSNMAWTLARSEAAPLPDDDVLHAGLRLGSVKQATSAELLRGGTVRWLPCSPANAAGFSAVGYFFGRALRAELDVPIGIVNVSWGGTTAEAWISMGALEADPTFARLLERWKRPKDPNSKNRPAGIFNAMVFPLTPFAIRGVIWYQGESNAGRANEYRSLFPALIRDWRRQWGQGDFPFHFVQLANYQARDTEPGDSAWAELREAQLMALRSVPNTGMAVTIDIGSAGDIHPRNKMDVGARLARSVLAGVYGRGIVPGGPLFRTARAEGDRMKIEFDQAGSGLATADGSAPIGFAVAGADRVFAWAEAVIDGDTVIARAPGIPAPIAVRYAWADNPAANLVNAEGLPASPFRSDAWPGITVKRPRRLWIYRGDLVGRPRAMVAALHQDLSVAFDPTTGSLCRAWTEVPGAARVYFEDDASAPWSLTDGVSTVELRAVYQGHLMKENSLVFRFDLERPDAPDAPIHVEEWPEFDSTVNGDVRLVRRIVISDIPDGHRVRLRLGGEAGGTTWQVDGAGRLEISPPTPGAAAYAVQSAAGTTTVTATWPR